MFKILADDEQNQQTIEAMNGFNKVNIPKDGLNFSSIMNDLFECKENDNEKQKKTSSSKVTTCNFLFCLNVTLLKELLKFIRYPISRELFHFKGDITFNAV